MGFLLTFEFCGLEAAVETLSAWFEFFDCLLALSTRQFSLSVIDLFNG